MATRTMRSNEIDATTGPILKKLIIFALPLIGVSLLQILFNSADVFVLSQFASDQAVGAVGSTTVIVNLFVVFFIEYLDNKIKTPQDMEKHLSIPVLGVIPNENK